VKVLSEICILYNFYKMFILECVSGFTFILRYFLLYFILGLRSTFIKVKQFSCPIFVGMCIVETTSLYVSDLNNKCHCRTFNSSLDLFCCKPVWIHNP